MIRSKHNHSEWYEQIKLTIARSSASWAAREPAIAEEDDEEEDDDDGAVGGTIGAVGGAVGGILATGARPKNAPNLLGESGNDAYTVDLVGEDEDEHTSMADVLSLSVDDDGVVSNEAIPKNAPNLPGDTGRVPASSAASLEEEDTSIAAVVSILPEKYDGVVVDVVGGRPIASLLLDDDSVSECSVPSVVIMTYPVPWSVFVPFVPLSMLLLIPSKGAIELS